MSYLAAIFSGILSALAFPTIVAGVKFPPMAWLAWIALIPFFLAIRQAGLRKAAILTFVFSLSWNGLTSYWIFNALYFNGQLGAPASLGVLFTMAFLLASLQIVFILAPLGLNRRWGISLTIALPLAWTFYEWLRNYFPFGGYPWANLGYTQAPWLTLLQSADLFGVYGLSFLIVLVNAALAEGIYSRLAGKRFPWKSLGAAAFLFIAFLTYGTLRLSQVEVSMKSDPTLPVALLQPNIGQQLKWKQGLNSYIQELLRRMTREAEIQGASFVVWPETALPTALPMDLERFAPLSDFKVPVLLGVLSTQTVSGKSRPLLRNSALQVNPGGAFAGRMHKQHLVPLGEYVPLQKLLWFVEPVVPKIGEFLISPPRELLSVDDHPYGVTICYEDLFPEIARKFTRMGAQFLVNISNDAWYGDVSQPDQHLNFSVFRAVENRRALIRGTNTGLTAAIDPSGRIHAEIPKFIKGVLITEIPLATGLTVYARWGDALWLGLFVTAIAIGIITRRKGNRPPG